VNDLCCTIAAPLPDPSVTIPIVWYSSYGTAPSGGQLVQATEAGKTTASPITPTASQRFWLYQYTVNVQTTQEIQLYAGDVAGDYATIGRMLAEAKVVDKGGLIARIPIVPLGQGFKLFARGVAGAGTMHVTAYGFLETIS
jgi:hypothetical protein